jgi:multiple sugar transport system ATP-binding protein
MRNGRILQVGSPSEVYEHPADVFTAKFIGTPSMNVVPAAADGSRLRVAGANQSLAVDGKLGGRAEVLVGVRPHDLVVNGGGGPDALTVSGTVNAVEPLGAETLVHIDWAGVEIVATASGTAIPAVDSSVTAAARPGALHLFDAKSEAAIGRA